MGAPLSQKERELVAVGASVAAGCIPCTHYHVKAVHAAGATEEEITRAVDAALAVKERTQVIMRRVARDALAALAGHPPPACRDDAMEPADTVDRLTELISIGAAVAVNCSTSFRRHVEAGHRVGVRDDEIQLAVTFARMIHAKATHTTEGTVAELSSPTAAAERSSPTAAAALSSVSAELAPATPATSDAGEATAEASCCGASPCR